MIGLKVSRRFFNQWEAKPKPIAPCTRDISTLSDWFKSLASIFQPMRSKTKINRSFKLYTRFFPRFEFWYADRAVCSCFDWSEWLHCYWFFDSHLKTALIPHFVSQVNLIYSRLNQQQYVASLFLIGRVITHHYLEPIRKPTKTKAIVWVCLVLHSQMKLFP